MLNQTAFAKIFGSHTEREAAQMKVSLMGLGDQVRDPVTGNREDAAQRHRAMVEAAVVADETGYHSVHIGEHQGQAYIYSAPPVMLAAVGERTRRIRLSTAVTLAANLDLMLPSAFGNPAQFKPVVELYRERFASYDHGPDPVVGACWHANVAESSQAARATWEPRYHAYFDLMNQIIPNATPDPPPFVHRPFDFARLTTKGPAIVGSPAEVVDRLGTVAAELTSDLNLLSIDMGGQPAKEFLEMTELIGTQVIPQLS
jgi:alkanesulfonate monooxygenase SsuD/methylene tetrahydromethanopterin reductase-like flavin-dependent oxidoreductase (luciferase family)